MIERLAVVGVGLLGGSAARAARASGLARQIVGVGRAPERLRAALDAGVIDRATTDLAAGVADADFVLLAAPVLVLEELLARAWRAVAAEAVVTDVGSTKANVVRCAERLAATRPVAFVGSHPMAGSERSGFAAAHAELFRDALVVVTPTERTAPRATKTVTAFWEALGARVATLDPDAHDRAVAAISHLPHLVADALVAAATRSGPEALALAARGFRDTTRIAASEPAVWAEIFLANRAALRGGLEVFRRALDELEALVAAGDRAALHAALARIKADREALG